jgi:hypothetical protein
MRRPAGARGHRQDGILPEHPGRASYWRGCGVERSGDEAACRDELRQLAAEAALLGRTYPLFQTAVDQRQRIAAESEGPGRMA